MDPSPTDSNGTENTEIDEDSQEDITEDMSGSESGSEPEQELEPEAEPALTSRTTSPAASDSVCCDILSREDATDSVPQLIKIATDIPARSRANSDDAPPSVIHAPTGFVGFVSLQTCFGQNCSLLTRYKNQHNDPVPVDISRAHVTKQERGLNSPSTPDAAEGPDDKVCQRGSNPLLSLLMFSTAHVGRVSPEHQPAAKQQLGSGYTACSDTSRG